MIKGKTEWEGILISLKKHIHEQMETMEDQREIPE